MFEHRQEVGGLIADRHHGHSGLLQNRSWKNRLEPVHFNLRDRLEEVRQGAGFAGARKGLELLLDVRGDVPDTSCGDPVRFRQVVTNLVGNAIKFTEQAKSRGDAGLERQDGAGSGCISRCATPASEFPLEKQRVIFEAFSQADGSTTRKFGGTGLGTDHFHAPREE